MELKEYFQRLKDKKVLVLGLGVSNQPLVELLLDYGIDVTGCDRTPYEKLSDFGCLLTYLHFHREVSVRVSCVHHPSE